MPTPHLPIAALCAVAARLMRAGWTRARAIEYAYGRLSRGTLPEISVSKPERAGRGEIGDAGERAEKFFHSRHASPAGYRS